MTIPRFCKLCLRRLEDRERDLCSRPACLTLARSELKVTALQTMIHAPPRKDSPYYFVPRPKRVNINQVFGKLAGPKYLDGKVEPNADKPLEALNRAAKKIVNEEMLKRPFADPPHRVEALEPTLQPGDVVCLSEQFCKRHPDTTLAHNRFVVLKETGIQPDEWFVRDEAGARWFFHARDLCVVHHAATLEPLRPGNLVRVCDAVCARFPAEQLGPRRYLVLRQAKPPIPDSYVVRDLAADDCPEMIFARDELVFVQA